MASDPQRPLIGGPPETLQDSLQALVGGDVRIQHSSKRLDWDQRLRALNRAAGSLLRGQRPSGEKRITLGLAYPELPGLLGRIGREKIVFRDQGERPEDENRGTVMHEFGHIADFRKVYPQVEASIKEHTPAGESPAEHFADAYMEAIKFLQGPQSHDPRSAARIMERVLEANAPGSQQLVEALLAHPLYADHPLNKVRR
jgi:hypothetical protein